MSFIDITDSKAVQAAMREYDKLGRTTFLNKYGYAKAKEFMVRDGVTGRLYDSKAIAGVAHGYQFPNLGPLDSTDFSGGEATVERKLVGLGFEVVRINNDWSHEEVVSVVADYFDMLAQEQSGKGYNKAKHNESLRERLVGRTKGSIEMKHQNVNLLHPLETSLKT